MSIRFFDRELRQSKTYRAGTHRARSPRQTIEEYRHLMERCGVTRIANVTGLDFIGVPVYCAIQPAARCLCTSQGKGLDADSAKASALMEAIETWHAEFILRPLLLESHRQLARSGRRTLDPASLNCLRAPDPIAPRLWIEGCELLSGEAIWVPFDAVTLNSVARPREPDVCRSSNGLASGNHLLEAMSHGLCEVIERDAEALWRLTDDLAQIDLTTVTDPYCREVLDRLERAGVVASVWDITSDVGVPAFGCAILEEPDRNRLRHMGIHYGFGAHLDPAVAFSRAVTEAVQTRAAYISGSRDDLMRSDYAQSRDIDFLEAVWGEVQSSPRDAPWRGRSLATGTFEGDVRELLDRLVAVGIEQVVAVELTRPDIGVPVAKMVVPGLEGPEGLPGARAKALAAAGAGAGAGANGPVAGGGLS